MDNAKTGWYAAYAIEPNEPYGEPVIQFSPISKWVGNVGFDYTEEGLVESTRFSNFVCYADSNDPENPQVREALYRWWKRLLKSQNRPMLH